MRWTTLPQSIWRGRRSPAAIGAGVYLLVVRTLLIRRGRYVDPIPPWLDLERGLYRPALRFLAQTAIVLATLVDRLGPRLLFHGIPCLFQRLRLWWTGTRDQLLLLLTGEVYSPRPTVEQAADDFHFARYEDEPRRLGGASPTPWHSACCSPGWAWSSACCSFCCTERGPLTAPFGSDAVRFLQAGDLGLGDADLPQRPPSGSCCGRNAWTGSFCSLGVRRETASFRAMRSSHISSVFLLSLHLVHDADGVPAVGVDGFIQETGSRMASRAKTTSSRLMSRIRAISSTVGSFWCLAR